MILNLIRCNYQTLVVASILPFVTIAGAIFTTASVKYQARTLAATSSSSSIAEEAFSSIRTVMAFGAQSRLAKNYKIHSDTAAKWSQRLALMTGISSSYTNFSFHQLFTNFGKIKWQLFGLLHLRLMVGIFFSSNI